MPSPYARSHTCRDLSAHMLRTVFATELRAWHGAEPLWKVFWGYGVFASAVLALLYLLAIHEQRVGAQQALLVVMLAYTVWILVAIWRCAAGSDWGGLARGLTIAWAGNTLLVVGFLQMDLIVTYIGR